MTTPTTTQANTKLQQTAHKLGLSVKTLEQYMDVKTAEVTPRQVTPRQITAQQSATPQQITTPQPSR